MHSFNLNFYKDKKVLITGHTGFKGTWMCTILRQAGAQVFGYALEPPKGLNVYDLSGINRDIISVIGDVRDLPHLNQVFDEVQPEIVIHMAAQPIVRESYNNPAYTYEVNVMGTVNILECIRKHSCVRSFVNVTTDKVYLNKEWEWGYRENEELNGYDPYSNSKSCSELVTSCYKKSFFDTKDNGENVAISTVRAGNVIGGGDFSVDRIIPDCVRAAMQRQEIVVRNPYSIRPYQHVLEPVMAYLMIAQKQYEDGGYAGNYNVGPDEGDCRTTGELVTLFCDKWNQIAGDTVNWKNVSDERFHEANFLKLDNSKIKKVFGWQPRWNIEYAVEKVVKWTVACLRKEDTYQVMCDQINEFVAEIR